ncbi:Probable heme oxygenase [Mycobacteroides abscessus subsp. bolletii]|uniref:biliverdin-producing heme oxygenase n=1 Tax=Mycobacteroides abscessus TaxID=36809 RepID=UPI0005E26EA6|nr:biliverdin-producing heme oxygenase [Mycobacteroides abscessus]AMU23363.1 heme oxygenase [Mycobacteroides abscessus]CPW47307.1 Probable heme oxygenase [Mycobacteroides abscessus]SHQ69575.1 Probable heme oxygenase [Mycobacteroides abscessus subsp. bolletii]SHS53279.1 Probable heme oxygenase [Mycobacteroides abscessus subsp. bolletii]SHS94450.1 Probable heme oxygenase [Mycobacteroides abscessus subsp. bolletii]
MNLSSSTVPASLSLAMRDGSRAEHDAAEQSPFISELLAGRVNTDGYVDYLMRLQMIYTAIEDAVRAHREDPLVAAVYDPALERHRALAADLEHWAPGTRRQVNSAAAQAYQDRIARADWTGALVAHHYVRYLGDLSGGQAIGRMLDRAFGLGGAGLSFYDFPMRPKPYKDAYRARLDELGLSSRENVRIVDEVKIAFGLNQAVFDELSDNLTAYRR